MEEQFYLVWPALLVLFTWAAVELGSLPTVAYFSSLTRAWELASGSLLAVLTPSLMRLATVAVQGRGGRRAAR